VRQGNIIQNARSFTNVLIFVNMYRILHLYFLFVFR